MMKRSKPNPLLTKDEAHGRIVSCMNTNRSGLIDLQIVGQNVDILIQLEGITVQTFRMELSEFTAMIKGISKK